MSDQQPHLLAVDDEADITDLLDTYFTSQGFRVSVAHDGVAMRKILTEERVDLVLLDLGLPGEDGMALTRYLREHWDGAVIIVTGRGDSVDRIVGLEVGADDYVTKPFDLRELLARVKSVLRRTGRERRTTPREAGSKVLRFAGLTLDPAARRLTTRDGQEVTLTTGEFDLLATFARHPNRVLSRDQLLEMTRNREAGPFDRTIDVQVGRLRKKIELDPEHPALIKAVRGAGYMFTARVEADS